MSGQGEAKFQAIERTRVRAYRGPGFIDVLDGLGAGHSKEMEIMEDDNKNKKKGKRR